MYIYSSFFINHVECKQNILCLFIGIQNDTYLHINNKLKHSNLKDNKLRQALLSCNVYYNVTTV